MKKSKMKKSKMKKSKVTTYRRTQKRGGVPTKTVTINSNNGNKYVIPLAENNYDVLNGTHKRSAPERPAPELPTLRESRSGTVGRWGPPTVSIKH
jgi:hypothetical protein